MSDAPFAPTKQTLTTNDLARLKAVHPALEEIVIECAKDCEVAFTVFEGVRTKRRQAEYVKKGVSKTMNSFHLLGLAVDLVPLLPDKTLQRKLVPTWDVAACRVIAAAMARAYARLGEPHAYTWGGSWRWFDGPHFQLSLPNSATNMHARTKMYIENGYRLPSTKATPQVGKVPEATTHGVVDDGQNTRAYEMVADIQDKVNAVIARQPARYAPLGVDGKYGPSTELAVKTVQRLLHITSDGIWGPATERAYQSWRVVANISPVVSTTTSINANKPLPQRAHLVKPDPLSEISKLKGPHIMQGYKTYVVAAAALLAALASYLTGEATLAQAIQLAVTALLGMTLRSGINSTVGTALEGVLTRNK